MSPVIQNVWDLNLLCLTHMNNTLESYKIFPYVAWGLVIGFAIFTYILTMRVNDEISGIDNSVNDLEMRVERLEQGQQNQSAN